MLGSASHSAKRESMERERRYRWWCAGQCFKRSLLAFANFHGVNTATMADFKLPTRRPLARKSLESVTFRCCEPV